MWPCSPSSACLWTSNDQGSLTQGHPVISVLSQDLNICVYYSYRYPVVHNLAGNWHWVIRITGQWPSVTLSAIDHQWHCLPITITGSNTACHWPSLTLSATDHHGHCLPLTIGDTVSVTDHHYSNFSGFRPHKTSLGRWLGGSRALSQPEFVLFFRAGFTTPHRMEEYSREPCPWRIIDDCGGAFSMGLIGVKYLLFCTYPTSSTTGDNVGFKSWGSTGIFQNWVFCRIFL